MPRNPDHPTIQEIRKNQTHCINGHELTSDNTYIPSNRKFPYRQCRKCKAIREAERRARNKVK
jgi:hypothetical protein